GIRDGHVTGVQTCALPILGLMNRVMEAEGTVVGPPITAGPPVRRPPWTCAVTPPTPTRGVAATTAVRAAAAATTDERARRRIVPPGFGAVFLGPWIPVSFAPEPPIPASVRRENRHPGGIRVGA